MVDVVIEHCRQQVVRGADCVKVAGKVQVDVFHRHDLGITTAGSAALDAEAGTKRRFAQAYQGLPAGPVHGIAETDRGSGLALPRRRRTDGSGQDQFAVGVVLQAVNVVQRQLGLVMAVRLQVLTADTVLFRSEIDNVFFACPLGNLYV